ncbi:MAG: glutathione S-transferase family protein [Thermoplasmata archaeon]|nr:glutathione S-transferase family protein [Thermoplasmata archaeon]MCI4361634.1 glutathione S-transferase family protein [Thermoplasmata archaeon]
MPRKVRLYYGAWSHYCVCAGIQLAMKQVEAEFVPVPYHDKTDLIAATGQDYIPALSWDGKIVPWTAIPDFLEAECPMPTLYPSTQRGLATLIDRWGHQVLEEKAWRFALPKLPEIFTDARERWVFEEIQSRLRGPWHLLETRRAEFGEALDEELAWIDTTLQGREWLLGEPSLADCGVYGGLSPIRTVGEPIPEKFPNLAKWVERLETLRYGGAPGDARVRPAQVK